jgi:hypothetical protein
MRVPQVLGPKGTLLTNRMTELVTYGSVGGGGSNPASYPAVNPAIARPLQIGGLWRGVTDPQRSALITLGPNYARLHSRF